MEEEGYCDNREGDGNDRSNIMREAGKKIGKENERIVMVL